MSNSLAVKITADVAELQAKAAVARAELSATTSEMNKLARAAATAGTGQLTPELLQAAQAAVAARGKMNELSGELEKAGVHTTGLREIGATLHELASGDVSRLPINIARLSETFFELGPAALGAVGAVAALGAGLFELGKHAEEAHAAMQLAEGAFIFGDNPDFRKSLDFVDQLKDKIAALPGVTEKSAGETVAALASIKNAPKELLTALAAGVPELTASFGSAQKGVEAFVRGWNEIQEKGGDTNAYIKNFVDGLRLVEERSKNAEVTQKTLWESVQLGLIGAGGDAQTIVNIVGQLDASKIEAFGTALQKAIGSGGVVKEKGDPIADFRLQVAQMEAAWTGGHEAMLAEAVRMWDGERKAAGLSTAQQRDAAMSLAEAQKSYNSSVSQSAAEAQRKAEQAARQAALVEQQIDKDKANTTLELSKIRVQQERDTLDAQYQLGLINAQQKGTILRNLAEEEYKIDLQRLDDELATLNEGTVAWQQTADRIQILMAQHQADLAKINREIVLDSKKTAQDDVTAWQGAVRVIESAESGLISNILGGRQRLSQSLLQVAGRVIESELAADAKALTMKLLLANTEATQKKALEAGGVAYHLLFNQQDMASTTTTEATKTAAVTAGSQARAAAEAAGAAEGHAASAALGSSTVMADAAKAAAGAYSALAGIPIVGPVIAPIAAGVAFAAVAAYSSLASSAGGDWDVAGTRLNIVHARETIMPATVAGPMRDFFTNGGAQGQGSGGAGGQPTVNVAFTHNGGSDLDLAQVRKYGREIAQIVSNQLQRNPSLRPAY